MSLEPMTPNEDGAASSTGLVLHDTYTLGARIGRGGMGEVYEATHARLPGRFAVKILRSALSKSPVAIARFSREAEIMSALHHPHIIQIFDFNTSVDGLPYFVMEYLEGVDLETRLASSGALPLGALVRIVEATASALAAAHALDIVHRDLKPANIFLVSGVGPDRDFVKVLDFGISKTAEPGPSLSQTSVVMGTPEFMSPEQALGLADQIDARTDQFALGAITYTMLTGSEPFAGDSPTSLLYQVVHEPPAPLARFFSWDTTAFQVVIDRALAKRREDRFGSVDDFALALRVAADWTMRRQRPSAVPERAPAVLDERPPPVRPPERPAAAKQVPQRRAAARRLGPAERVPRGSQRAIALGLGVLALTAGIVHNGWYRGFPRHAAQMEHASMVFVRGEWRPSSLVTVPSAVARTTAPLVVAQARPPREALPPSPGWASAAMEAAPEAPSSAPGTSHRADAARARASRRHPTNYRSGWQSITIPYHATRSSSDTSEPLPAPTRFPDPSLTPPPQSVPAGFPIPPPAALPPARDLAPAPSPPTRSTADDVVPGP